MNTNTAIARYLDDVDAHLVIDGPERQRALEEIEGHLRGATETLVAQGFEPDNAVQRAITEFGLADEVANGFVPAPSLGGRGPTLAPTRLLPIVVPALLSVTTLVVVVQGLIRMIPDSTHGEWVSLRGNLLSLALFATLTIGGWVWLRGARRRTGPSPAWVVTVIALVLIAQRGIGAG